MLMSIDIQANAAINLLHLITFPMYSSWSETFPSIPYSIVPVEPYPFNVYISPCYNLDGSILRSQSGACLAPAHCRIASKSRHVCVTFASGSVIWRLSSHAHTTVEISDEHMRLCRMESTQWSRWSIPWIPLSVWEAFIAVELTGMVLLS